jgi:hypothetical protein
MYDFDPYRQKDPFKVGRPPFFQPKRQWDPGFPGQISAIAEQLSRGFGGDVADQEDYLRQMYKPMFKQERDPYVPPVEKKEIKPSGPQIGMGVVSHMPGKMPVYGNVAIMPDKIRNSPNIKKRLRWLKNPKNRVSPGATHLFDGTPAASYDPYGGVR